MSQDILSLSASKILKMVVDGYSIQDISADLDLPAEQVQKVIQKVDQRYLPKKSGRASPAYKLTHGDQKKGGAASQKVRQEQRRKQQLLIHGLIDLSNRNHFAVCTMYWVMRGSEKEFLVTIPNELVGKSFLKALISMSIPESAIHFQWRSKPMNAEEGGRVRESWGKLGRHLNFSDSDGPKSLRLRVSSCSVIAHKDEIKVSSRGLAQAFISRAKEALNETEG